MCKKAPSTFRSFPASTTILSTGLATVYDDEEVLVFPCIRSVGFERLLNDIARYETVVVPHSLSIVPLSDHCHVFLRRDDIS